MKKAYIHPHTDIYVIETAQIMGATSVETDSQKGSGKLNDVDAQGPALSRNRRDVWDDDDD